MSVLDRFRLDSRRAFITGGSRGLGREMALALACKPSLLLLDEPAAGVPEDERHEILDIVTALPESVTVLLIEHDMELVFSFADRISVLVQGALFAEGDVATIASDSRVKAVYLGEEAHV